MATQITSRAILTINGKQVEETFNGLKRASSQLERELRKLTPGTEEFIRTAEQLREVNARFAEVRTEINATRQSANALNEDSQSLGGTFDDLGERLTSFFSNLLSGNMSFKELGAGIKVFAAESWLAISSIPIIGWVVAFVAAVGLATKEVFDYNKSILENVKLVENTFNNLGDKTTSQLDTIRNNISGISETFGIGFEKIAETVDKLLDTGAVKTEMEALAVIKNGLLTAPNKDEFLANLESAAEKSKQTGLNIQEIVNLNRALEDSPVDGEAVFGALEKATKNLTEQSDNTRKKLSETLGAGFTTDLLSRIDKGTLSVTGGLAEISTQATKMGLSVSESANLGATLLGRTSVAAGGLENVLNLVVSAQDRATVAFTPLQQATADLVNANTELAIAKDKALKSDNIIVFQKNLELLWIKAQTLFYGIVEVITDAIQWFDDITGYSETLGETWDAVKGYATQLWETVTQVVDVFKDLYDSLGLNDSKSGDFIKTIFQFINPLNLVKNGFKVLSAVIDFVGDSIENSRIRLSAFGVTAAITMVKLVNAFKNFDFSKPIESLQAFADLNITETYNKQFAAEKKAFDQRKKLRADQKAENQKAKEEEIARNIATEKAEAKAKREAEAKAKREAEARLRESEKGKPSKTAKDNSAKEAEAARKKTEAERKKNADQIEKDDEDAKKQLLSNLEEFQKAKSSLIENEFQKEAQEEADRRNIESRKTLTEIADLETKKYNTKSATAKAEYQKSIDILHQIEILNEDTHQKKLLAMQEKWDAINFEKFVQAEQKRITEGRRLDEDAINNISSMEAAQVALSEMKYLKLTDQELRGIRTLEDAKRALREDADRKMLEASKKSLIEQRDRLTEALKGVTGEAAEKLKANLDEIITKITQVQSAINGGTEADTKKVEEDKAAAKGAVDVLGFSVEQWDQTFSNLDTTAGKLKLVGMVFAALSNAGQMFADLQKSIGERDLRRFEAQQNKKKSVLEKQLNEGYITQEDYNKQIQKIEAETANKKAELAYKQAKADKVSRMFAIIGNTAMGVSSALAAPFPVNLTLPWIVGAMGAVQLGLVAAQPLPERPSFARGGFTGDGFGAPDATGYKPAGIVHQNEWIAPEWMLSQPRTARIIDYLESVRQGNTQAFAEGGFVENNGNATNFSKQNSFATNASKDDLELKILIQKNIEFLEYLISNGVHIENSLKNSREFNKILKSFPEIENKNKH